MKHAVVNSGGDNVSAVTSLISRSSPSNLTFFVCLPVVLFPSLTLPSDFSPLRLSVHLHLAGKQTARPLILPLKPGRAGQRHRAISGNRINGRGGRSPAQERHKTASDRKHRKRDYEKRWSVWRRVWHVMSRSVLQRVKNVVQRWESQTDRL